MFWTPSDSSVGSAIRNKKRSSIRNKKLGSFCGSEFFFCTYFSFWSEQKLFFCLRRADLTSILVIQREMPRDTPMPSAKSKSPIADVVNVTSILFSFSVSQVCFAFFLRAAALVLENLENLFSMNNTKPFHILCVFMIDGYTEL